jgi:hypothetical protein
MRLLLLHPLPLALVNRRDPLPLSQCASRALLDIRHSGVSHHYGIHSRQAQSPIPRARLLLIQLMRELQLRLSSRT